jgi:hypothetical protein
MHIGFWWEKPEGKGPIGRPRDIWEGNIRMDLREMGCGFMEWIHLAQYREEWRGLVNTITTIRVPLHLGEYLRSWATGCFSS